MHMSGQGQSGTNGGSARSRAVALVGPYGSGKSTLFDALIEAAGGPARRDKSARRSSTETRLGHCTWLGDSWSLLDCPGSVEFSYEVECALEAVDVAVVVCDPVPARALAVAPILKALDARHIPHIVFVNKIDTLDGHVRDTLGALQGYSAAPLVLRQVPIRQPDALGSETVAGVVDVISERAYRYRKGQPSELIQMPAEVRDREAEARNSLLEVLADHDDALLEKLLEDIQPSTDEIFAQLRRDQADDKVVEVLLGSADNGNGLRRLWKALRHDTPTADVTAARRGISAEGDALGQIFKSAYAGHAGKLSYARIWRGTIKDGSSVNGVRIGSVNRVVNGELVKVPQAVAGEVVGLGRLENLPTGTTVSPNAAAALPFPAPPPSVYALAVGTEQRADDVKLSGALQKLVEEDPALAVVHDADTGETVLHGQGEMHLITALERLKTGFNLKLSSHKPQTAYKETIRKSVHQHGRLKRQTGGHGQFADVKIDIAPRERGEGFIFYDKVVGGAVPRNFIPAVGEAAEEASHKGPLGFPVVDISVTLVDGQFHSVDSSDMAFRTATRMAMQEGLAACDPVLLEPIERVTVTVPNIYTAAAQRLLTGRRGRILGYEERAGWSGWDDVEALVPAAELHDFIIELRSQTQGLGSYVHSFDHLAETLPPKR
jgi:elongation factor G